MKEYPSVNRLQEVMAEKGMDLIALWPSANWIYLVPFAPIAVERPTYLLISRDKVSSVVPEFDRAEFIEKTGLELVFSWDDSQGPKAAVSQAWHTVAGDEAAKLAIDDTMPFLYWKTLEPHIEGKSTQLASDFLMELRMIKEPEEIEGIRRTSALIERVLARSDEVFKVGMTEKQVEAKLKNLLLEEGADTLDYVLVQAASNCASPHHMPGEAKVKEGEPVLVDIAISSGGFFSDITRQVCLGTPSEEYQNIFSIVREAQAAAVDEVKPGIPVSDIDKAARSVIEKAGTGEYFNTRTGHGLGLEVHEPPSVWGGNPLPLRTGMVFTIEPGIYITGKFGVRIEDTDSSRSNKVAMLG